jgi:hypothetical protein
MVAFEFGHRGFLLSVFAGSVKPALDLG